MGGRSKKFIIFEVKELHDRLTCCRRALIAVKSNQATNGLPNKELCFKEMFFSDKQKLCKQLEVLRVLLRLANDKASVLVQHYQKYGGKGRSNGTGTWERMLLQGKCTGLVWTCHI